MDLYLYAKYAIKKDLKNKKIYNFFKLFFEFKKEKRKKKKEKIKIFLYNKWQAFLSS
jgi:hypothetical protein